jgi:hypothetical protein
MGGSLSAFDVLSSRNLPPPLPKSAKDKILLFKPDLKKAFPKKFRKANASI